jgi:hypothetical protein
MKIEDAAALIEADKRERARAFAAHVQEGVAKFACDLVGIPQLTSDGRIVAMVQIVAR